MSSQMITFGLLPLAQRKGAGWRPTRCAGRWGTSCCSRSPPASAICSRPPACGPGRNSLGDGLRAVAAIVVLANPAVGLAIVHQQGAQWIDMAAGSPLFAYVGEY